MGSTGEPDRKRRLFTLISPTSTAKKQPAFASSEDKKLDVAVLHFQNQKLVQQLEAQNVKYSAFENKFHRLEEKQATYDDTLVMVNNSWQQLIGDLEFNSACLSGPRNSGCDMKSSHMQEDGVSPEEDFLNRLSETGATESCSGVQSLSQMKYDIHTSQAATRNILQNILTSINYVWHVNDEADSTLCMALPEDECYRQLQNAANDLILEVRNFRVSIHDLHLKHRLLANKIQNHRDIYSKNKSELRILAEESASTNAELEESKCKLASIKAQKDAAQGAPFLFPTLGNKHVVGDKLKDTQKEQDLDSTLKDLRIVEIRSLHERRINILKRLADLQNAVNDVHTICSSKGFLQLSEHMDISKSEMDQCRTSLEKLQVENDSFVWLEKKLTMKSDLADIFQRFSALSESEIAELEHDLQRFVEEKILIKSKLVQASREPGRKEIIAGFKALVSSLSDGMTVMQSELCKYKEAASEIHSLRAEVQSLSSILDRKVGHLEMLSGRSIHQLSDIKKLQGMVRDLRESNQELKLILGMYSRESTESREVIYGRNMEYRAWAHVQSLKSSLDEHKLELRVTEANEAEAISQQRLATTEAEIADLRQSFKFSGRDTCNLSVTLRSKHEEGEAYLSEIESIGHAYEDMQTQNHHLLHQIIERDDHNIKLVMEDLKARQLHDALCTEVHSMDGKIQLANPFLDLFHAKVARFDDQLKLWSDQVSKLVEDGCQNSTKSEDAQRRLTQAESEYQEIQQSLGERQGKAAKSRLDATELLVDQEKERFNKKRAEEALEVMERKATGLRTQVEGSTALGRLKREIKEYRGILRCQICHDRQKEVVIAKCYHLFCCQCVQKTLESRHRKCPSCGSSFGPNDVKPIYI